MGAIQENEIVNNYEAARKKAILASTPQYVTLGTHYGCNARCVFCLGGDYPHFSLDIYKNFFEKKLGAVLAKAGSVGFCGFGETLLMPGIEAFLDHINAALPDASKVFTTNGFPLAPAISDRLAEGKYAVLVSLHAANAGLHRRMTGTPFFPVILDRIKYLNAVRKRKREDLHISLVFLLTTLNIENLPDFVTLARELEVERVSCNYLTIFEPEQIRLSCFFEKEKTNAAFDEALARSQQYAVTLVLPPRFGEHPRPSPRFCYDPWNFFYVETQGSVNPCCFAGNHIGYLDREDFSGIWNGPGYLMLRNGLLNGDVHRWCKYCYKYDENNVNDIRSHITFRPDTQQKILQYLKEHAGEFDVAKENLEL